MLFVGAIIGEDIHQNKGWKTSEIPAGSRWERDPHQRRIPPAEAC
jgi:hypothetical protein